MDLVWLLETMGEDYAIATAGLLVGLVFGIAAQRSRFCLRAAAVEFARGNIGPKTAIWLLTFATALFWTQGAIFFDVISIDEALEKLGDEPLTVLDLATNYPQEFWALYRHSDGKIEEKLKENGLLQVKRRRRKKNV